MVKIELSKKNDQKKWSKNNQKNDQTNDQKYDQKKMIKKMIKKLSKYHYQKKKWLKFNNQILMIKISKTLMKSC